MTTPDPSAAYPSDPSRVHVLPVNDLIEHEDVGDECVCGPDVEYVEGGGKVIVHHSLDGREEAE